MTKLQQLAVVFNPWANRGRAAHLADAIRWSLRAAGFAPELFYTTGPGEATTLVQRLAHQDRWAAVVAAGGDGTINEVVNGLWGCSLPLGVIPIGTGNDFVKMLGLRANDLPGAVARIASGQMRTIDVGTANGRVFVNGVGVGIDAQIAIEAQRIKRLNGMMVYVAALLRTIVVFRPPQMRISVAGDELEGRHLMVTIGNGRCHGGGFWITPAAEIDDGLFDLCVVQAMSTLAMLRHFPKVMRGTHTRLREVSITRTRQVHISASVGVPVHLDGEILGAAMQELNIELHRDALRVLV